MNNEKIINWGIIGCGAVAEKKSGPAYQMTPGFHLHAVMRRDLLKAKDFAERHGVDNYYSNADELINDPDIHGVYIATPPDSHKQYALKVAAAEKICCIEKPMASSYEDCRLIFDAFDKKSLPLFIAYYRRSLPRFKKIKQLLDDGAIGQVRHVSWHLSKKPNEQDLSAACNWRTDKQIAPGGYFDDLASHGLNLFSYFLGDFENVNGVGLNQQKRYSALDAVSACWVHVSGVTGSGSWNFACADRQDKVDIYGSHGHLRFSIFADEVVLVSGVEGEYSLQIENPNPVQLNFVQDIKESLFNAKDHPSDARSAAHTNWVMQQVLKNAD